VALRAFEPVTALGEVLQRSATLKRAAAVEKEAADVGAECGWLARQLKTSGRRLVGLLPATKQTDVIGLATSVGAALTLIVHGVVIIADPNQRSVTSELPKGTAIACAMLGPRLVTLTPTERPSDGGRLQAVKELLEFVGPETEAVTAVLLDLSSFALPGELLGVIGLVDGIVIVGPAGRVTEAELLVASRRVPAEMNMGVVLTD
jgi:hypothetical protein